MEQDTRLPGPARAEQEETNIEALPQPLLAAILEQLPGAELSRCGGVSAAFRSAAAAALRARVVHLWRSLEKEMAALEVRPAGGRAMLHVQRRHSVLRLLMAVVRVIRACCWRYMRTERAPLCLGAGALLDEAMVQLSAATERGPRLPHVDPGDATRLLLRTHDYLDHFDSRVEPVLAARRTPFGVKLVDLLDCSQTASQKVVFTHQAGNPVFFLSGRYEMRSVRDPPPMVCRSTVPGEMKLQALARYVRGCVGWGDVLSTVRHLWNLEDAAEAAGGADAAPGRAPPGYSQAHHRQTDADVRNAPAGTPIRLEFTREGVRDGDGPVLCCEVQLQGDTRHHLPLDLEHLAANEPPPQLPPPPPTPPATSIEQHAPGSQPADAAAAPRAQPPRPYQRSHVFSPNIMTRLLESVLREALFAPRSLTYESEEDPPADSASIASGSDGADTTTPLDADWSYSFSMSLSLEQPQFEGGAPHQQVLVMLTHSLSRFDLSSITGVDF